MKPCPNLPSQLTTLIESGIWPITEEAELRQNLKPIVSESVLRKIIKDESRIYFYKPPFTTISKLIEAGEEFWTQTESALHQIDPDKTLLLGDFGAGSDTVFALDYRESDENPTVIRLQWSDELPAKNNKWVVVSESFKGFCDALNLTK